MQIVQIIIFKLQDWAFPLRMRLGRKIMYDKQRKIVQVSTKELIKGPCSEQELEAMEYAKLHTLVDLPRVHRIYRRREGLFIAMDFINGERLDEIWPRLDDEERRGIACQIWSSITQLHACRPAEALGDVTVASISGGSIRDGALGFGYVGPFSTLQQFDELLNTKAMADGFERHPERTCFVHADLAPRNVIRGYNGRLYIIDWEFSGWWPLYWERIKWHFADFPPLPNWVDLLDNSGL